MLPLEAQGHILVWAGLEHQDENVDLLIDLCGLQSYDIDFMECAPAPMNEFWPVDKLVRLLSYGESFGPQVCSAAQIQGLHQVAWLTMLLNHSFVWHMNRKQISESVRFLGVFEYDDKDDIS